MPFSEIKEKLKAEDPELLATIECNKACISTILYFLKQLQAKADKRIRE